MTLILKKLDVLIIIKQNLSITAVVIHPNTIFTVCEFGFLYIHGSPPVSGYVLVINEFLIASNPRNHSTKVTVYFLNSFL